MLIVNLTQHLSTPEQRAAGVVDLPEAQRSRLKEALDFDAIPTPEEMAQRLDVLVDLALMNGLGGDEGDDPTPQAAMIGGVPFLMAPLERALSAAGIQPAYAFSRRVSIETHAEDGTVSKSSEFRHLGFVEAFLG